MNPTHDIRVAHTDGTPPCCPHCCPECAEANADYEEKLKQLRFWMDNTLHNEDMLIEKVRELFG